MKTCEVCGISEKEIRVNFHKAINKTLCQKHYMQFKNYSKFFKRTEKDPNEIIKYENYAEVVIYNKVPKGEEPTDKCRTIIDLEDIHKVSLYKWKVTPQGYVFNYKVGLLSRYLLDMNDYKIDKLEVDHIDNNPLNNKRSNLRKATSQEQKMNTRKIKTTTSIYKGVKKHFKKWKSEIVFNGNSIHLGLYKSEYEAGIAYDKKAIELFGEFANLNILDYDQYIQSKSEVK